MSFKANELESTKTRLRLLGLEANDNPTSSPEAENNDGHHPVTKNENRVQFDLKTTRPTPARLKSAASGPTVGPRRLLPGTQPSQLPSDTRQRLEEMVHFGVEF